MNKPLVTVLMPVYNAGKYLHEAIESILNQTFADFEFLIIEDGSTDNSLENIKSYNDKRIRLVENGENIKLIATLNKGIELANGKYIARMDADDISLPERLQKQVNFMENHPDVGALGTAFISFGENFYSETFYPENHFNITVGMLHKMQLCHASTIIRKSFLIENNLQFSYEFPHAEDYDFFYRLSLVSELANLPETLFKRRVHPNQVSEMFGEIQNERSLNIKRIQFKNLGIELSDKQIDVFTKINYYHYEKNEEFLFNVKLILEKLDEANKISSIYNIELFTDYLQKLWFNVCTNLSCLGYNVFKIYKSSPLCKNNFLLLKLFLKTIIKK